MEYPFAIDLQSANGGISVVRLLEPLDAEAVPRLAETLRMLTDGNAKLVLDMSRCDLIVSTGIGVLHHYKTHAEKNGGDIALAAVPPFVAKLIRMTLGTELIRLYANVADALKALS